jgi:hypothetical protein
MMSTPDEIGFPPHGFLEATAHPDAFLRIVVSCAAVDDRRSLIVHSLYAATETSASEDRTPRRRKVFVSPCCRDVHLESGQLVRLTPRCVERLPCGLHLRDAATHDRRPDSQRQLGVYPAFTPPLKLGLKARFSRAAHGCVPPIEARSLLCRRSSLSVQPAHGHGMVSHCGGYLARRPPNELPDVDAEFTSLVCNLRVVLFPKQAAEPRGRERKTDEVPFGRRAPRGHPRLKFRQATHHRLRLDSRLGYASYHTSWNGL